MAVGVALTLSEASRDSGFRLEEARLRRQHRHRDRDETSRMPTSGATSLTELGMSLKSSLGGERGRGGLRGDPPVTTSPQPHTSGCPYLVTPMCRARTSQELPVGRRGALRGALRGSLRL